MLKVDDKQLRAYVKDLKKFRDTHNVSEVIGKQLTTKLLNLSIDNTPVGSVPDWISEHTYNKYWRHYREGELRKAWTFEISKVSNSGFQSKVFNPMNYAKYVEYGHRQDVGRYVGAIERRLVKRWVEGSFMLTNAEHELESKMNAFIQKEIDRICEKLKRE